MAHDLLKAEEVASLLKVSKYTVYEMIKRGQLPATKLGRQVRVSREVLDDFLKSDESTTRREKEHQSGFFDIKPVMFVGSHDISIENVFRHMKESGQTAPIIPAFVGSMEGLLSLYYDRADLAGCHLFDEETGDYNLPVIKRLFSGEKMMVVRFVERNIGWAVPAGNPKNLGSWEDLARSELTFVNRQKGSGTRVLLDYHVKSLQIDKQTIAGYSKEELTHYGAASAVARGDADFTLAAESAAIALGLDFIPLFKEQFDLVMKEPFYITPTWKLMQDLLQSQEMKDKVSAIGGYDVKDMGKTLAEV